jgi:UDP-apiose/xylose synthase
MKQKKNITILGCGGFIGSHLLERLLQENDCHIDGIDINSRKIDFLLDHKRFIFHNIDIADYKQIIPFIQKSDILISLAALCNPGLYTTVPIEVIENNFVKLYPLIQICGDCGCHLVHFSTSEVYGRTLQGMSHPESDDSTAPERYLLDEDKSPLIMGPIHAQRWCYACAKQLLERTIFAYGYEKGLDYTIIRPFNFIGPRMDFIPGIDGEGVPRVLACFMDSLLNGKPLKLVDGGKNRRCFTAIDDAVEAVTLLINKKMAVSRQIINIGNPENEITIAGLAEVMISLYKEIRPEDTRKITVENVSSRDFYGEGYEDCDRRVPDCTKLYQLTEWNPKIGLDEALKRAIQGFISRYSSGKQENSGKTTARI